MKKNYSCEKNILILISLLKQHKVRHIIASPGATNANFVASVQNDSYFIIHSAVDERAAAYMACGLAEESGEVVVLTCTGATASRNYIPGLTEAYQKNLPVLAVTASLPFGRVNQYAPQQLDRTVQSDNVVKWSVRVPTVLTKEDTESAIININNAILELTHGQRGPVHVELAVASNAFASIELPKYRKIQRFNKGDTLPEIPQGAKVGVVVGAHEVFDKSTEEQMEMFCHAYNAIVLCDQTSNYRGKHRVLCNLLNEQEYRFPSRNFDLVIHIGYVSGAYMKFDAKEVWRVNPDGQVRDTFRKLTNVFEMQEKDFFEAYSKEMENAENTLLEECNLASRKLLEKIPVLPFSNLWIASKTASLLPENAVLHLGILNSLRAYNFFETPSTVSCFSNTGGFGIDGCVSSMLGAALASPQKEVYGVVGDLAFFYDQNTILRKLPSNIHLMVVNNGIGAEFKNYNHRCAAFGEDADRFVAAKGHNGCKSADLLKEYAQSVGMKYFSANSKEQYEEVILQWLAPSQGPVLLEVFTSDKDESEALKRMHSLACDKKIRFMKIMKQSAFAKILKRLIGK